MNNIRLHTRGLLANNCQNIDNYCQNIITDYIFNEECSYGSIFKKLLLLNKEYHDAFTTQERYVYLSLIKTVKFITDTVPITFEVLEWRYNIKLELRCNFCNVDIKRKNKTKHIRKHVLGRVMFYQNIAPKINSCKLCGMYEHPIFKKKCLEDLYFDFTVSRCPLETVQCKWCLNYFYPIHYETIHENKCGNKLREKPCDFCNKQVAKRMYGHHIRTCRKI